MTNPRTRSHRLAATTVVAALTALTALTVSACGGGSSEAEPKPTVDDLFQEYLDSVDVVNDPHGDYGDTTADRHAAFAAYGDRQQTFNRLLHLESCESSDGYYFGFSAEYTAAAECPTDASYRRRILVKHEDESLEVLTLFLTVNPRGTDALVDSTGESYTGGLDDFREHNDLLDDEDLILAPRDLTDSEASRVAVISGHTSPASDAWRPWLIGASATAVAVGIGGLATLLVLRRRAAQPTSA